MVSNCANPECAKPLHYLREGRIFVFEVQEKLASGTDKKPGRHLEHFWLCGVCSMQFQVEQERDNSIRVVPRRSAPKRVLSEIPVPTALAS